MHSNRLSLLADEPTACSQRLQLADCLRRYEQEAEFGAIDTGHYRCKYVVWGRGPTLVLIPGMASDAISFAMLMARLQAHFRCVSYDLPDGDGDGAALMKYRHDDLVGDLFVLLDHLHIRDTALLGFSFGSTIALAAAARQPARFSRVILQGGFARRPITWAEVLVAYWARFLPGRVAHLPMVKQLLERVHREPFRARDDDVWDFFLKHSCQPPLRAFASRALMLHGIDLRPLLPSITQPTMLVVGDRDPLVGKGCEQELMHGLPMAARAEIEDCGHQPHLTHPEVLAEIVLQFLKPAACGTHTCQAPG